MTLAEVRAEHPGWVIEVAGLDLLCRRGAWRVRAIDPDDAHAEILRREPAAGAVTLGVPAPGSIAGSC